MQTKICEMLTSVSQSFIEFVFDNDIEIDNEMSHFLIIRCRALSVAVSTYCKSNFSNKWHIQRWENLYIGKHLYTTIYFIPQQEDP